MPLPIGGYPAAWAGLFSGFDPEHGVYDPKSWRYDAEPRPSPANQPRVEPNDASTFSARGGQLTKPPRTDPTLQHPRCVFQILRRHYARYTPEMVEQVCGTPEETFLKVAETLWRAPRAPTGRRRSATPSAGPSTRPASR